MNTQIQQQIESGKSAFWRRHLEQWRASGQSQVDYCYDHCLAYATFHYWKRKFSEAPEPPLRLVPLAPPDALDHEPRPALRFATAREEAEVVSPRPEPSGLRLQFAGVVLEVDVGFHRATLHDLLALLEARHVTDR